ncbi:MAG: polysaccharide biosynthesis protein, partial [Bacteroides sp.]
MHTYIGVLRYSSFVDISRIFVSLTLSYGLIITMDILYPSFVILPSFPVSIILMTYIINLS